MPDYAGELLDAFPEEVRQAVGFDMEMSSIPQPLVEPLSERELEVLRLMATGLKYQEIAGKLVVSVNTVRHHTRNIYGKLDVNSRALIYKNVKFVVKNAKIFWRFLIGI